MSATKRIWKLKGLDCAECAAKIETAVASIPGVSSVDVNYIQMKMTVSSKKGEPEFFWKNIEHKAKVAEDEIQLRVMEDGRCPYCNHEHCICDVIDEKKKLNLPLIQILVASVVFIVSILLEMPYISLISYAICGYEVIFQALKNFSKGKIFDENFLMGVASLGAVCLGDYREAAAVMLFYQVGEYFQDRAVQSSKKNIADLMDLKSDTAVVREKGQDRVVKCDLVEKGQIIIIRNGEKVPLDGIVTEGTSYLDTKSITGEPEPRKVTIGDPVISGCVNKDRVLSVKVTKAYEDSTVKKILDLVQNSSQRKAPSEQFITRFARYYTPFVVFSALALAIIPTLLTGNYQVWIYRALVFLVISCPCALVISVPLSYFSGIGALAKKGVLVKGGNYLQALAEVDMIAFDKTGTITEGNFTIQQVVVISPAYNEQEILQYCGALEKESSHPVARAISQFANSSLKASKVQEIAGKGIRGMVGGKVVVCGNDAMLTQLGLPVTNTNHQGTTVVEVVIDNVHVASILIGDRIKKGAKETLALLKKLGIKKTVMLTGDTTQSAEAIAQELGIDQVRAQLLPQDKVLAFESLKGADAKVAYVGDGINDAPVLGLADVGISMGAMGSDAAIEASDIVVMTDDINHVGQAYYYAKKTSRTVKQNITVALTIKLATLILGAFGLASMWLAIFADVGVAMLAILNSLRLMIPRNK